VKLHKCKACGTLYVKTRPLQSVCSIPCSLKVAREKTQKTIKEKDRQDKKAVREKLAALTTKPQLVKLAQVSFNSYIRQRDALKPCISCGKPADQASNGWDASHYRSVGSSPHLRFVEANCHKGCKHCNQFLAGNIVEYRKGLIDRIGLEAVEALEADQTPRKYTHDELRDLAASYRAKLRELKKQQ
jgi:hypothetical protein